MMYNNHQNRILTYMKPSLILTDAICSNMAFVAAFFLVNSATATVEEGVISKNFYSLLILFNLVAIVAALHLRLYADDTIGRLENVLHATWKSAVTLLLVFTGCTLLEHQFTKVGYFLSALAVTVIAYVVLSRFVLKYIYTLLSRRSH